MAWDNRKRIQLARGTSAGLVANTGIKQAGGQPVFISDKRYLTVGVNNNNGGENTVIKQVPIRARTLMGWYADQEQVTGGEADTFTMTARPTNDKYSDKYILTADSDKTYFSSGKSLKFYRADATKFDGAAVLGLDYTSDNRNIVNIHSGDLRSSKFTVTDIYAGTAGTASLTSAVINIQPTYAKTLQQLRLGNNQLHNSDGTDAYTLRALDNSLTSDYIVTEANSQALTNKTIDRVKLANTDKNNIRTITTANDYTLGNACEKGYTDSTSASAISTGDNLVTERDVYHGLPNINGSHEYTSENSIYAPTAQLEEASSNAYYLIGAKDTTSISTVKTYSACYAKSSHLYSDSKVVINSGASNYAQEINGSLTINGYLYV